MLMQGDDRIAHAPLCTTCSPENKVTYDSKITSRRFVHHFVRLSKHALRHGTLRVVTSEEKAFALAT